MLRLFFLCVLFLGVHRLFLFHGLFFSPVSLVFLSCLACSVLSCRAFLVHSCSVLFSFLFLFPFPYPTVIPCPFGIISALGTLAPPPHLSAPRLSALRLSASPLSSSPLSLTLSLLRRLLEFGCSVLPRKLGFDRAGTGEKLGQGQITLPK